MAEVVLTRRAVRDLDRLQADERRRIVTRLRELADDPLRTATKLSDPRLGTFRYRIGPFRVIFDLEGEEVVVLRIGHRREVYR